MKLTLIFILIFISTTGFSQSIESIDKLVSEIEMTNFTDTITIVYSPGVATRPIQVTAYLKGDTLLKTVAHYSNSTRLKFSYYDKHPNTAVYVKDIDSLNKKLLVEVYGKSQRVYKSKIVKPLTEQEIEDPYHVLLNSDFSIPISLALIDRQAQKYKFTGKLVETVAMTPHCGYVAFAIVHKFEVLKTSYPNYDRKYVLIIQTCPEFLKENFFQTDKVYDIDAATNSGVPFDFTILNNYEEDLPIFWTREIERQK